MSEFKQRRFFERRKFMILEDGVQVTISKWPQYESYKVPFEQVSNEVKEVSESRRGTWLWIGMAMLFFGVLPFFASQVEGKQDNDAFAFALFLIGFLAIGVYLLSIRRYVGIVHPEMPIVLLAGKPSTDAVNNFVREVCEARDEYLQKTYSSQQPGISPLEYLERLAALHQAGALTDEEFAELKRNVIRPPVPEPAETGGYL